MRRAFGRLLFAAFVAGQLQLIPAAIACVREHRQPTTASHCATPAGDLAGAALVPVPDGGVPLCALLGPCAVPNAAIAVRPSDTGFAFADTRTALPVQSSRPESLDLVPPAPPPEA